MVDRSGITSDFRSDRPAAPASCRSRSPNLLRNGALVPAGSFRKNEALREEGFCYFKWLFIINLGAGFCRIPVIPVLRFLFGSVEDHPRNFARVHLGQHFRQ